MKKGKYYEMLEKGKMQVLGNIQRAINPWAVFNPWTTQETKQTYENSTKSSRFHVYDDAAAATINPWAVFNPWATQETRPTSDSSEEGSRFHIKNDASAAAITPWAVFNPWDAHESQTTLEIHQITQKQIKADAYEALRCQGNLGPRRVLNLLRHNIAQQLNAR